MKVCVYEALVNTLFADPEVPLVALCQYRLDRFDPQLMNKVRVLPFLSQSHTDRHSLMEIIS